MYSTGVSTSTTDLMNAIKAFAALQGFTVGASWTYVDPNAPTFTYQVTAMSKNGIFYHFNWLSDRISMNTATGSAGSGAIVAQVGACPVDQIVYPLAGPHIGYHLFGDGKRVHCVVEISANVFTHLSFGEIDKTGNGWVGGAYVTGTFWSPQLSSGLLWSWTQVLHSRIFDGMQNYNTGGGGTPNLSRSAGHVRASWNGATIAILSSGQAGSITNVGQCPCSPWLWGIDLVDDSPNSSNNRAALIPVEFALASVPYQSNAAAFQYMQIGQIPTAASIDITNLNPKDTVNTDWMVFPLSQKNGDATRFVNTLNYGMAYKK